MALDAIQDIAGIVLAAGAGRRMGYRPKALLQRDGQPLVARQIGLLAQCSVRRIMVVLGHHAARIAPVLATTATALPGVDLNWVVNPTPDEGTGASLRCALAALPADLTGVLALPVDHARCTQDIDTEDDLARLTAEQGVRLSWPDLS